MKARAGAAVGPGFFGKMPARGDFVAAGLPGGVVQAIDRLLQDAVALCRDRHGQRWDAVFPALPAWRFALDAGICGARPVAGAVLPSADRVGRRYPLVLAALLPDGLDIAVTPFALGPWFRDIEAAGAATATGRHTPDALAARLDHLGPPRPHPACAPAACRHRLEGFAGPLPRPAGLWWTEGNDRREATLVVSAGPPPPWRVAVMLGGDDERKGHGLDH